MQAFALSLTNTVNAAMNKAAMFLAGITGGDLTPCEGYIAKLQARAAKGLLQFREDLKIVLVTRRIVMMRSPETNLLLKNPISSSFTKRLISILLMGGLKTKLIQAVMVPLGSELCLPESLNTVFHTSYGLKTIVYQPQTT